MTGGRVGLGIVGLGRWANAHAQAAARSDSVEIVNCHSRSPEGRAGFQQRYEISRTSASLDELLTDEGVEAVIVSTPNDLHAEHAAAAVRAGEPVLVDKPLSVDVAEGLSLLRMGSSVPVGVAHHPRRLAGHREARRWITSGEAGAVQAAHADFSNNRGLHMSADAWHRSARGSEAGVLIQVGIHQVDNVLYLLGPAASVNARFTYGALGPRMPEGAALVIAHTAGAISTVTSSWTTPSHYRLELLATEGNLVYRLDHRRWTHPDVDDSGELVLEHVDGEHSLVPVVSGDPLVEQLEELGRAARTGAPMAIGPVEGLRVVAVIEAAVRSAAAGGAPIHIADLLTEAGATTEETALMLG